MSEFDIRNTNKEEITQIRICDSNGSYYAAEIISKWEDEGEGAVELYDSEYRGDSLKIFNKEHAENLIKGLEYTIELGWFD